MVQPVEPLTEREEIIWRLHCVSRWSNRKIGDAQDPPISDVRVSQILAAIRQKLPPVDIESIRQHSIALHQEVQRRAFELADMNGTPVTAGRDGGIVYDPETNEPARDFAGRVRAMQLALDADREIRKLLGADAATKTESTGTVRYELVNVDPSALT